MYVAAQITKIKVLWDSFTRVYLLLSVTIRIVLLFSFIWSISTMLRDWSIISNYKYYQISCYFLEILCLFDPVERNVSSQFRLCYFAQNKLTKFKFCIFTRLKEIFRTFAKYLNFVNLIIVSLASINEIWRSLYGI